ncbi:MAG: YbfB/YjiJ family MFS transporter [Anaeromyxobacter sp.]
MGWRSARSAPTSHRLPSPAPTSPLARALAGGAALAAAMGIGRFAYTALLPATQRALGVGDDVMGAIASANLVAYLAGVLVGRRLAASPRRGLALAAGLVLTALAALGSAATVDVGAWVALRVAAGLASGVVFVLGSAAALEGEASRPGVLYAGVGLGIALSGAVSALAPVESGAGLPWLVLGGAAAVLAVPGLASLTRTRPPAPGAAAVAPAAGAGGVGMGVRLLAAAYFLEGLGYIVSGTFAVAAVRRTPGLEALAPWTWVLAGLSAAPSALLWSGLGNRLGGRRTLALAHGVQAVGMALPSLSSSAAAALTGAALFGGTFIGITTLAMSAARRLSPEAPGRMVGTLSAVYGVGQMLGPILAGALSQRLGDPRPAVLAAAGAVATGGVLLGVARERRAGAAEPGRG